MIGSGYIAVELAGILNALGSDVTLVVRYDRVLRSFDRMLSDSLMAELDAAGVKVVKFSKVGTYTTSSGEHIHVIILHYNVCICFTWMYY